MITYQDWERAGGGTAEFIRTAVGSHTRSDAYLTAIDADEYDAQRNVTISRYARMLYGMEVETDGAKVVQRPDPTASNNRICSNFFHRLNVQRVQYSLGNGVSFVQPDEEQTGKDRVKEAMGRGFDRAMAECALAACEHGEAYAFWNHDRVHVFKMTEFVPLYDERTGVLRAGIRFWRLDARSPLHATFYREDGYSEWSEGEERELSPLDRDGNPVPDEVLVPYVLTTSRVPADGVEEVVGGENYGPLPIVPMRTSSTRQSTLVGMRGAIDAYDLVKSGFADDVQDCAAVYWIVRNAGGMTRDDLAEFRDRLKLEHIAHVDSTDGADVQPYTQELPTQARQALLKELRDGLYEDFGALDVHAIAAGSTNDHIDAAYQPMDDNAADFEYWVGECIRQLVRLAGFEDEPVFQRNRISNQKEQVEMVVQEAQWLDTATVLRKLPNVRPDEVAAILAAMEGEDMARFGIGQQQADEPSE